MADVTVSRREFLFYGGATLAGVTLGEVGRRQLARADERAGAWRGRAEERWATSVCRECAAACGTRVRLLDGIPVKLEGNPLCPIGQGRLCPNGQAALESYFDPDRLLGPVRRLGERGENRWEPLDWESATALLAEQLRRPASGEAPGILALGAEEHGPLADAWAGFWEAAGGRVAWTPAPTAGRLRSVLTAMTGAAGDPVFDLEHASYVLSFGAPIVEDWLSPVWTQRSYGRFRRSGSRPRGYLVQVEGRRSMTARKADEWLAIPTHQQVTLAYGIAAVLLRENRVDRTFLDEFGGNVEAFEAAITGRYSTDNVATEIGVPAVTLLRLARELVATEAPQVTVGAEADPALVEAVFALDALIGAFGRRGGVSAWNRRFQTDLDDASAALGEVAEGRLRPRVVAFRDASALRALHAPPDPAGLFESADLIVSFSPYLDETAAVADVIMPTHTALEGWHAVTPAPAIAAETLAVASAAVPARLETRDCASILKSVAAAVGGPIDEACPWTSSEELARLAVDRVWGLRRGGPYTTPFEMEWVRQLEQGGWWVPPSASREEFMSTVLDVGGWADPLFEMEHIRGALRGQGGVTFMLSPSSAASGARPATNPAAMAAAGTAPAADPSPEDERFPFRLEVFTPAVVSAAGSPNQPVLYELLGQPESLPWQPWAELNPETGHELGVEHGTRVRVMSEHGSLEVFAIHVEGSPADAVALAFVPAVPGGGRWARFVEEDARRLCGPDGPDGCRVRIVRV